MSALNGTNTFKKENIAELLLGIGKISTDILLFYCKSGSKNKSEKLQKRALNRLV